MDLTNLSQNDIIIIIAGFLILYMATMWYLNNSMHEKIDEKFDGLLSDKYIPDDKRTYDGNAIHDEAVKHIPDDQKMDNQYNIQPDGAKSELTELYDFSPTGHVSEGNVLDNNLDNLDMQQYVNKQVKSHKQHSKHSHNKYKNQMAQTKDQCLKEMMDNTGCYECSAKTCGIGI